MPGAQRGVGDRAVWCEQAFMPDPHRAVISAVQAQQRIAEGQLQLGVVPDGESRITRMMGRVLGAGEVPMATSLIVAATLALVLWVCASYSIWKGKRLRS